MDVSSSLRTMVIASGTGLALLVALARTWPGESRAVVALASKAGPKLQALEAVLCKLGRCGDHRCTCGYRIEMHKVSSGVAEQPCGHEETKRGAFNRLAATRAVLEGERCDYIVAIENGIVMHNDNEWYDFAWILVEDCASQRIAAVMSTALRFPKQYVEQARNARGVRTRNQITLTRSYSSMNTCVGE